MNEDYDDNVRDAMKDEEPRHYSERFYEASLMITAVGETSLSGFCSCGTDAEYGIIYHLLRAIDGRVDEPDDCIKEYMIKSDYNPELDESPYAIWGFPHTPMSEFLAKFLDSGGLTEHGTTVVWSWLDKKGRAFVDAMDVCIDEYCKANNLDQDDFRKGPFGFSRFNAEMWWGGGDHEIYMPEWVWKLEQSLVTNEHIAQHVAYRLFTKDEDGGLWINPSDELKKDVDKMLDEIVKLQKKEAKE